MREILFRAKRIDNGEWVEGFYSQLPKPSLYIIVNQCKQHSNFSNGYPLEVVECEYYEIDSETLCQYTGLTDKNGKKIFIGDVIRCSRGCPHEVIWLKEYAGTYVGGMPAVYLSGLLKGYAWTGEEEKIGNIFDDPELLKGE